MIFTRTGASGKTRRPAVVGDRAAHGVVKPLDKRARCRPAPFTL